MTDAWVLIALPLLVGALWLAFTWRKPLKRRPWVPPIYNAKVQEVMDVVERVAGSERWRVRPERDKDQRICGSRFEVYFDHWQTLGYERGAFGSADRQYGWHEMEAIKMIHRCVGGVTSDRVRG